MQEIKLSKLTKREAYELDQRLAYCAATAFKEAIAAQNADKKHTKTQSSSEIYNDYAEISKFGVNVLASSYMESLFVSDDEEHVDHVRARLQIELNKHIPSDDHERQEVLIPIMAYALIVSNEYNEETVKKRIQADADKRKVSSKSNSKYPYNRWKHVDPYTIKRKETTPDSSALKRSLLTLKSTIKKSNDYTICGTYYVNAVYTLLKNWQILIRCQDIAKISLFLRCILIDSHNSKTPMNSLIRLYLANHLDNMLQRSYSLCDGNHVKAIVEKTPENNLLSCYCDSFMSEDRVRAINCTIFPSFPQETEITSLNLKFREEYSNLSFTEIYHDLIDRYSISDDDLNMLLDFYLDGESLSGYAELVSDIKDLTKSIISQIDKKIIIPNCYISEAMMFLTHSILRPKTELPTLHINPNTRGSWHGSRLERHLCVPRITLYKPPEAD